MQIKCVCMHMQKHVLKVLTYTRITYLNPAGPHSSLCCLETGCSDPQQSLCSESCIHQKHVHVIHNEMKSSNRKIQIMEKHSRKPSAYLYKATSNIIPASSRLFLVHNYREQHSCFKSNVI